MLSSGFEFERAEDFNDIPCTSEIRDRTLTGLLRSWPQCHPEVLFTEILWPLLSSSWRASSTNAGMSNLEYSSLKIIALLESGL